MKVKELQKTVNVAWSPAQQSSIMLAAGTAAQQLDTSANSVLEIYSANLSDPGYDLELKASQPSEFKFQKIIWSPSGIGNAHQNGLLVGGCEGGHLLVYSAAKLLAGEDGLVARQDKHTGAIRGLDFNPFQNNLLASVASESEVFIWDLNNTSTPMAPGTKTQPLEDVQSVAWNRQVQHIVASVYSSRCVIWDLRKNEQIMKLSDSQSRVRWRALQWHPEFATQLWLASEDDSAPYVQLWDLRYATAPAKTLQIHNRGILGLSWCPQDTELMISCGKDNKIICWNPNSELPSGEILGEVATTIQWYSDVQWCPRNPALISSSSLEGNVSIYSLFGGTHHQVQTSNKIADSFPGMDQFAQAPVPQQTTQIVYQDLIRPPKWMKPKAGVSFGFGGRLISFGDKLEKKIQLHQVITEPELVQRANALEKVLEEGNFVDYCKAKADQMNDQNGRYLWYFIKANFELNPRDEMLNLLGYSKDDTSKKFQKYAKQDDILNQNSIEGVTNKMATLTHSDSSEVEGDQSTDDSTDLSAADNNALFDAIAAGNKTLNEINEKKIQKFKIPIGEDNIGLISEAILSGNLEAAVEICLESERSTEALIIASTAGIDFLTRIQNNYLIKQNDELANIIAALVQRDWIDVMSRCTIDSWKEALVAALTHSDGQIGDLCVKLGDRLEDESTDINISRNALLCYICAGNVEKLVEGWLKLRPNSNSKLTTNELQELVEIIMLLKKALELRGQHVEPAGKLAEFLSQYAGLLASQGALDTALSYLSPTEDPELENLRERLYYALGHKLQQRSSYGRIGKIPQNAYGRTTTMGSTTPLPNNRFNQPRNSFSNTIPPMPSMNSMSNSFNTGLPGQPQTALQQPWSVQPTAPIGMPPIQNFNSMLQQDGMFQNTGFNQPFQPSAQAASMMPPPPPPAAKLPSINDSLSQPQRPSSVGSQGSGPLTRKYIVDPSVSSGPTFGQPTGNFAPINNPINQSNFGATGQPSFNSSYSANQMNSGANDLISPQNPISFSNFKPFAPTQQGSISNLGNHGGYGMHPIETAQQVLPPPPSTSLNRNPTPPPGWNDPPPISSSARSQNEMSAKHAGTRKWQKIINANNNPTSSDVRQTHSQANFMFQQKSDAPKLNPITHPIFGGVDPNQNGYTDPNSQYSNQNFQPPPNQTQMYQPQQQVPNAPPQIFNPQMQQPQQLDNQYASVPNQMHFKTQAIQSHMFQQPSSTQEIIPPSRQAEPPKEKPPLPEEYFYMQTVLEELKNQCMNQTSDQRTKRKVQEVSKRLEFLYDALRERRLSPNTINTLNQIVQFLQTGDYGNALENYTQIVSGPDFSQTANFMPGIKVLVQTASELKIYLR